MKTSDWSNHKGDFHVIHTLKDGKGMRTTKSYLRKIIEEMTCHICYQMKDSNLIPPFAYKEKQFHTVMAPAIGKISDFYLMESPVKRNWKHVDDLLDNQYGWVDYWSAYRSYDYYIELKHGFISYKTCKLQKTEKDKWHQACDQLNTLGDEIESQKDYTKGIFPVVFHVLPIYDMSADEMKVKDRVYDLGGLQSTVMEDMSEKDRPNWSCLWTISESVNDVYSYIDGYEKYPALLFLVKVFDMK